MPIFRNKKSPKEKSEAIIRNHIVVSMGAGQIPFPVLDVLAVSAIQLHMVKRLSRAYKVDFKETEGKAQILALAGSGLSRTTALIATKVIPGPGSIIGGVSMAVLSGASTFALGHVYREHFETGGTFLNFNSKKLKKRYEEKFKNEGERAARKIVIETTDEDITFSTKAKRDLEKSKTNKEDIPITKPVKKDDPMPKIVVIKDVSVPKATELEAPTPKVTKEEEPATQYSDLSLVEKQLEYLTKLAKLRDAGGITEFEYNKLRKKLLKNLD